MQCDFQIQDAGLYFSALQTFFFMYYCHDGYPVMQFVEALHYNLKGREFDSQWGIGICHWFKPSGRSMALGSTNPVTEMSTSNISWVVRAAGPYGWLPYHLHVLNV